MNQEQVDQRINSENNLLVKLGKGHGLGGNEINHENAGREKGSSNLSPFMREVISAAGALDTSPNVAKAFGISKAHAHNLKHGIITRPNGPDPVLIKKRDSVKAEINAKASDLVLEALGLVTYEKLAGIEKIKDLTAVAKDLSSVIEKTNPETKNGNGAGINVHVYSPGQLKIETFETIEVEAMELE